MQRIRQEHATGCGIACVAMVTGTTYAKVLAEARGLFGWPKSQRDLLYDLSRRWAFACGIWS